VAAMWLMLPPSAWSSLPADGETGFPAAAAAWRLCRAAPSVRSDGARARILERGEVAVADGVVGEEGCCEVAEGVAADPSSSPSTSSTERSLSSLLPPARDDAVTVAPDAAAAAAAGGTAPR
jgi:hypothetical protein